MQIINLILDNPDRAILITLSLLGLVAGGLEKLGYTRVSKAVGFIAAGDWGRVGRVLKALKAAK